MKRELLSLLCCPNCKQALELISRKEAQGEIEAGILKCVGCGAEHPIDRFVPRFVAGDDYANSFSFEWSLHSRTQFDNHRSTESAETFGLKTGLGPQDLAGKLVLDVGCGSGRFLDVAQHWKAIVVGVDLSLAVDVAFENMGLRPDVHIVQADVFKLPFKDETFDVIYSLGVLHHTPDCEGAFKRLPSLLKPGGEITIWVYPWLGFYSRVSDFWRKFTTRLPRKWLYRLSFISVVTFYLYRIPLVGPLLGLILPTSRHARWRWRVLDTFDWYSPTYQSKHTYPEVFKWFRNSSLADIDLLEVPISIRARKP